MNRNIVLLTVLLASLLTGGCSWLNDDEGWFVDRRDDYLDARQKPSLRVPGDLAVADLEDPFPIPDVPDQTNPQYFPKKPPLPNALYADDTRREVRLQRLADRQWLVVPEPPTTVWPKLKQFIAENGLRTVHDEPAVGRIDTDWFAVSNAAQYRDVVRIVLQEGRREVGVDDGRERLRFRVEQGLQAETSEIHLRYENDVLAAPSAEGIVSLSGVTSVVPNLEGELLNEIGAYIASRVSEQTVSKVATNIAGTAKAFIDRNDSGEPVLRLLLDRERAWAAVGRALANGSVDITAADPQTGTHEVLISDVLFTGEEEPGFFSRLFGRGGVDQHELSLQLTGEEENLELSVHELDGAFAERELSREVLSLVREFAG